MLIEIFLLIAINLNAVKVNYVKIYLIYMGVTI